MRRYLYVGPSEIREAAQGAPPGTPISSAADVEAWIAAHEDEADASGVWATYVVDLAGVLRLATRNSEHVACAGGEPVLAAGELRWSLEGTVEEISNLSTGYCPQTSCWRAVEAALDAAGVEHPGGFTFAVEFRRCEQCGQRNVVKDEWYVCSVCDAPLPDTWNF